MCGKPTLESEVSAGIGNIFGTLGSQMHHYLDITRCSRKNLLRVRRGAKISGLRQAIYPQPGVVCQFVELADNIHPGAAVPGQSDGLNPGLTSNSDGSPSDGPLGMDMMM